MSMTCSGKALIEHKATRKAYTIDAAQLDWESDGFEHQRKMGHEIQHRATFEHPCLGELVFEVWEYPEGVFNQCSHQLRGHSLLEDLTYEFDVD